MRLAQPEIDAIVHAAKSNFGPSVRVILFGSRVHDSQRGGDIDVFVETAITERRKAVVIGAETPK